MIAKLLVILLVSLAACKAQAPVVDVADASDSSAADAAVAADAVAQDATVADAPTFADSSDISAPIADANVAPDAVAATEKDATDVTEGEEVVPIPIDPSTTVVPQTNLKFKGGKCSGKKAATYKWSVKGGIGCEFKFLPNDSAENVNLLLNCAGAYAICEKRWCDGVLDLASCLDVVVVPEEAVHIELIWDTPGDADQTDEGPVAGADMDLHLAHPLASGADLDCDGKPDPWFDTNFDCFWFNSQPQWGKANPFTADDGQLTLDDTDGMGPENIDLQQPEADTAYSIGVHYWDDHYYGKSLAKVKVYLYGVLTLETEAVKMCPLDMWYVGKLIWPKVGGVPSIERCYQSGDACAAKKNPNDPLGGKMWQPQGANCIAPDYVSPNAPSGGTVKTGAGACK